MTYTIFPVEPPFSPSQLSAYKSLRLASLQIDPQSFLSTYAFEAALTEDVWRERLDSPFNQTFVVSVPDETEDVCKDQRESGEWIGTASVLGPTGMVPYLAPFEEAGVGSDWEMYGLLAMWVHPAHRGKGLGTRLVRACLDWARTNVDTKFSTENPGQFEKVMVLLVHNDNVAGRALYSRMGFNDLEGVKAWEGNSFMSIIV